MSDDLKDYIYQPQLNEATNSFSKALAPLQGSSQPKKEYLTHKEKEVLTQWKLKGSENPVVPMDNVNLFARYLDGTTCTQLAKSSDYPLGAILDARLRYRWDEMRDNSVMEMQDAIRHKLLSKRMESIDFMLDQFSAFHVSRHEEVKRYLESRDPEDLKAANLMITGLKSYKDATEILTMLTGEAKEGGLPMNQINLQINAGQAQITQPTEIEAAKVLEFLAEPEVKS